MSSESQATMTRRVLVTGANKGIGLAIVSAILDEHDDTFVFLGARDAARGSAARDSLLDTHPDWDSRVEVLEIDVSDDASVEAAAERVRLRFRDDQGLCTQW